MSIINRGKRQIYTNRQKIMNSPMQYEGELES